MKTKYMAHVWAVTESILQPVHQSWLRDVTNNEDKAMCNCHSESEQRLREHVQKQLPEGATGLSVELQGYVFGMGGSEGISHRAACPVEIQYKAPKKSGGMKDVKQKSFLRASFCPFCGEKYDKEAA